MAAWRFGLHGDCIGTHSVLRHRGAWRYDWATRPQSDLLTLARFHGTTIPLRFLSYLSILGGLRCPADAKVSFSRRLRHGHRMYVTTPPAAIKSACLLSNREMAAQFSCLLSDGDARETTFAT